MTDTCDTRAAQMNDSSRNSITERRRLDGDKCKRYNITIYYYVTKMICPSSVNCSRVYLPICLFFYSFCSDNYIIYYSTFFSFTKVWDPFLCAADSGCQSSQKNVVVQIYWFNDIFITDAFIIIYFKVFYGHSNVLNWYIFYYFTYYIGRIKYHCGICITNIVLLFRYVRLV